ncbi:putative oxidoreductase [Nymphon striatum]|nr:putative oxidoreductase [Nymphon striatum]
MDVADNDSVVAAAKAVGQVDGVVFLAGVYWPFGAKDWDADQANAMADVNFTGLMRVMGQVVPSMVARNAGHIVITSSLTGFRGLPRSIGYTASKAATMSLAECMYADLRKTGVQVQVVNPGFIKTQLTEKNTFSMPFIMQADEAARDVFEHMNTDSFKKSDIADDGEVALGRQRRSLAQIPACQARRECSSGTRHASTPSPASQLHTTNRYGISNCQAITRGKVTAQAIGLDIFCAGGHGLRHLGGHIIIAGLLIGPPAAAHLVGVGDMHG